MHLLHSHFGGAPDTLVRWAISGVAILVAIGFVMHKLLWLSKLRSDMQNGVEAEIAMGQELDQLMRDGAAVYHDFPCEGFNIDHVVITANGVYAVETKGRMKPDRGRGKKDASVTFDGRALLFPDWNDTKTLAQAVRQAKWLSKWISSAVGESIAVVPVVALPGWWVERTGRSDVRVISGREASSLLINRRSEPLSQQLMQRIEHQVESRCRDVEPSQFGKKEKFGRPVRE